MHAAIAYRVPVVTGWLWMMCLALVGQTPVRDVRVLPPGSVVTTTGTITTGPEGGLQRYLQDADAGIAAYGNALVSLQPGDSIRIRGTVSAYRGEVQLSPIQSVGILATQRPVAPRIASSVAAARDSAWLAMRVHFPCAGFESCYQDLREGPLRFFDPAGAWMRVHVPSNFPLSGLSLGLDMYATGILGTRGDQLILQLQDVGFNESGNCRQVGPGQVVREGPYVSVSWEAVPGTPIDVEWQTADTLIRLDTSLMGNMIGAGLNIQEQGDIHAFRLRSWVTPGDTISSPWSLLGMSDAEGPAPAFFFNRSLDESFSDGSIPDGVGSSVIETDIIRRIDEAVMTLDVAMYNTNRPSIVQALNRAASRGVQVRYIADSETSNNALDGVLSFPVYYRQGDGIMHHKLVIGDREDPARAWVWAGSTNFSQNQLTQDPNHALVVHDQAIARTFTAEFDELWGTLPGFKDSRYGDLKLDDTPHAFVINERPVEVYFSPSDETGCHILRAIESADFQILVGMLLITRDELVDALIGRHLAGVKVRVIVDDEESSDQALARLRAAGVPVAVHRFSPIFHHKYAIIDEGTFSDPTVVTGSHNWTFSADRINDEHVWIFRDQRTANIFRQEFEARWAELEVTSTGSGLSVGLPHAFPNPADGSVWLQNPTDGVCRVELTDDLGRSVGGFTLAEGETRLVSLENQASGFVTLRWQWGTRTRTTRLAVVR